MWTASFARTVAFAAISAVGWWLARPFAVASFGLAAAIQVYATFVAAAYLAGVSCDRRRAWAGAGIAAITGGVCFVTGIGPLETLVVLATALVVLRGRWLYRVTAKRAWLLEAGLLLGGMALALLLSGPTPESLAYGFWGFFLVQSAFFFFGGVAPHSPEPARDAFECARARLEMLLS